MERGLGVPLLCGLFLTWIGATCGISLIDTVKITDFTCDSECVPGKYFWRASQPTTFYACLNNWPERAIKMRCSEGTYMCNTGEEAFKPCQCKGLKKDSVDGTLTPLTEGNKNTNKDENTFKPRSLDEFAKMGVDPDEGYPARGCMFGDPLLLTSDNHKTFGVRQPDVMSLGECQKQCLQERGCTGVDWDTRGPGQDRDRCYLFFPEAEVKGAVLQPLAGVDHYEKVYCLSTPVGTTPDPSDRVGGGASVNTADTGTGGSNSGGSNGGTTPADDSTTPADNSGNRNNMGGSEGTLGNNSPRISLGVNLGGGSAANAGSAATTSADSQGDMDPTTPGPTMGPDNSAGDQGNGNSNRAVTMAPSMMETTTTIPDSGCPYTFDSFEGRSHPYGKNITSGDKNDEAEECKQWCLVRGYCEAVDFNSNTGTCYYLREINTLLMTSVPAVTHYRKVDCEPPLRCWGQTDTLMTPAQLSITDADTPMTECRGYCFTRQTMSASGQVVERGCVTIDESTASTPPRIGCRVEETLMTMTCYCDTPRCNGLSVETQAAQLLYLPLDGDYMDHSGMNRDALVVPGYSEPQFTCLDKSVNCSALFMGNQCLQVPSLAQTQFGRPSPTNTSPPIPKATFAIFFKRISGSTTTQGIFGNSVDINDATWRIHSGNPGLGYVSAGLRTDLEPTNNPDVINDFVAPAPDDAWHLAVMSYDGELDIANGKLPTTMFYIDEQPAPGNTLLNRGDIGIRNQPVSVGCVMNENFIGFLDEVRIFNDALNIDDVRAMLAMKDVNFW